MEPNEAISPSAYALLMMKSHTSIPYAREAAALLTTQSAPEPATPSAAPAHTSPRPTNAPAPATSLAAEPNPNPSGPSAAPTPSPEALSPGVPGLDVDPVDYWSRTMHFESRYWSINQLLADLTATNILEISSGFSFRGLDLSAKSPVYYIDTDLPNIIAGKQRFIDAFTTTRPASPSSTPSGPGTAATPGHYSLHPLNALDPAAFEAVVNKFPPGPLTIVNEGLLVYLDVAEKKQLCSNIRKALLARGGAWITADIYIKRNEGPRVQNDAWRQWSNLHQLEEKKFESFEAAKTFFEAQGFTIEKEATQDYSRLTSFPQFLKAAGPHGLDEFRRPGRPRIHSTWRLVPSA